MDKIGDYNCMDMVNKKREKMNIKNLVEKNKNSGITLIMVIISIIVLFIIVGVVIVVFMKTNNSSSEETIDLPDYDKYEIYYSPISEIESSETYKFYIDLKNKEITEIETHYWISEKRRESKNVKKIDDSTNNKLIEKIKEIEKNDNNKNYEEIYNFKNEKYKRINIDEDRKLDREILRILLEEI